MTASELLPTIFSLSPEEQLKIAHAIRHHLGVESDGEFKQELDRRYQDYLQNPNDEISWDDLSKELEKQ